MKVIVTCGPSYEPIDEVRRLTNFSTGELGVHLSNQLAHAGFEVFCLKGSGATFPGPGEQCHLSQFNTNDDLLALLAQTSVAHEIAAVLHVAALCDYKVRRVEDDQGRSCDSPKIASRSGALTISLEPATKVISQLRRLFPESILIGWKYELAGARQEALIKAVRQIEENHTDGCVLNGKAFGPGFAFCRAPHALKECRDKDELVQFLTTWLQDAQHSSVACHTKGCEGRVANGQTFFAGERFADSMRNEYRRVSPPLGLHTNHGDQKKPQHNPQHKSPRRSKWIHASR
jgi:phosphopantothenoylcysteine decarboxylase/phosphopantothenate--cysteine ligase